MWSAEGDIPKEVRPGPDIDDWPFLQQQKNYKRKYFCPKKHSRTHYGDLISQRR